MSVDFSEFTTLRTFIIDNCDCTQADLRELRIPFGILRIRLYDFPLDETDPGILTGFPLLANLDLRSSTFTDEHLHALASCTKLEELNLTGCQQVGNAQIPLLRAIPNLKRLDLTGTGITAAGIEDLLSGRPDLIVINHQPTE
jgi:hypothetical protein